MDIFIVFFFLIIFFTFRNIGILQREEGQRGFSSSLASPVYVNFQVSCPLQNVYICAKINTAEVEI